MTVDRVRLRWAGKGGLLIAIAVFAAAACSVEQTLPAPDCEEGGSGFIVAQSVPSATQIPCLMPLPMGWSVAKVKVNENHSEVVFDSDRAGSGAAVMRLDDGCDVRHTVSAPSELPAADRYDYVEQLQPSFRGERYYVFPGGCVWWQFTFDRGVSATEAVAIGEALVLISREDVNQIMRDTFIDEEI
jgi:hypothetical protein